MVKSIRVGLPTWADSVTHPSAAPPQPSFRPLPHSAKLQSQDLAVPGEALVTDGRMTREHADQVPDALTAASQDGSFFAYGTIVVALRRVPPS